ncbi:hypothetical protein AQJ66_19435 [Streptomyces bungoensis]|uniref:Uncharacterized protein n=1 Tax=Streptomyces bungoensis TaxID=285568 RepID=A0A101SZL0_9ACTN|nr:hypothetical protein AQJ66_19435 [Streptomyces bungoensis]
MFAALAVLHFLAERGRDLPSPDGFGVKDSLPDRTNGLRQQACDNLDLARGRGGDHWKAASRTFQSIPAFMEEGSLPGKNMSPAESAQHRAGYEAQLAAVSEDFPELFR